MSLDRLQYDLESTIIQTDTTARFILQTPNGSLLGWLNTTPTNGTSGSGAGTAAPGCLMVNTAATGVTNALYVNTNTKASPTWDAASVVAGGSGSGGLGIAGPAGAVFQLGDSQTLAFGDATGGDVAIKWDATDLLIVPATDNTGTIKIGNGTKDMDVQIFMNTSTKYVLFDQSASDVIFTDGVSLTIGHTAQLAIAGVTPELQEHGTAPADSSMVLSAWSADTAAPRIYLAKSRSATIGTFSIITTGDLLGQIEAFGDDGVDFNSNSNASAAIRFVSVGTIAADRIAGEIRFLTATDAAPSVLTERLRIDEAGVIQAGVYTNANVTAAGAGIFAGGIAFTDVANAWIDDATQGSGTTTHYIGNQTITTASDKRIKKGIETWAGSALEFLAKAPRQVEFTYNLPGGGPQDGWGPNGRGRYRGWLAQETVGFAPWVVNAGAGIKCEKCCKGEPCDDTSHGFWHVEYQHLVPMLVQAVNELQEEIKALKKAK